MNPLAFLGIAHGNLATIQWENTSGVTFDIIPKFKSRHSLKKKMLETLSKKLLTQKNRNSVKNSQIFFGV